MKDDLFVELTIHPLCIIFGMYMYSIKCIMFDHDISLPLVLIFISHAGHNGLVAVS